MTINLNHELLTPLAVDLLAAAVLWGLARARSILLTRNQRLFPGDRLVSLAFIGVIWFVGTYMIFTWETAVTQPALGAILVSIPTIAGVSVLAQDSRRFRQVGLAAADTTVTRNLQPTPALQSVNNTLEFLGTGASKLTTSGAFHDAVMRATRSGSTVRLLLSKPDSVNLMQAARRADRPFDAYKDLVIESLRTVADLKNKQAAKVEVRFYTGARRFRLMFIDEHLCLFSYNVYGASDQLAFPVLRVIKSSRNEVKSFYWALEKYFEDEWESASEWNFQEYL